MADDYDIEVDSSDGTVDMAQQDKPRPSAAANPTINFGLGTKTVAPNSKDFKSKKSREHTGGTVDKAVKPKNKKKKRKDADEAPSIDSDYMENLEKQFTVMF